MRDALQRLKAELIASEERHATELAEEEMKRQRQQEAREKDMNEVVDSLRAQVEALRDCRKRQVRLGADEVERIAREEK